MTSTEPAPPAEHRASDLPALPAVRRRRILISAYAFDPYHGSEPTVGWQISTHIAAHHDVVVLCMPGVRDPARANIQKWTQLNGPLPGLTIHFVEPTPLLRFLDSNSSSVKRIFFYTGYASWQRRALREARKLHAETPFDAAHHITIVGYREPGYLWKLGIPFFWGPIAGASNLPWRYFPVLGWRDRVIYGMRTMANEIQKRLSLRCRRAARAAAHIWAVFPDGRRLVTDIWHRPCTHMTETGTAPRNETAIKNYDGAAPLQLIFTGYHVGRKALPIVLEALAKLDEKTPVELTVLGDGPENARWKEIAARLGLDGGRAQRVSWIAHLPHPEALAQMSKAHAMVFPSLLEASSTVVPEAFSLGLPVVCHDLCGMSVAATPDCAIKIAATSPAASIDGFTAAIRRLVHEPGLVRRLSEGALRRSAELSWAGKAAEIAQCYDRILATSQARQPVSA